MVRSRLDGWVMLKIQDISYLLAITAGDLEMIANNEKIVLYVTHVNL